MRKILLPAAVLLLALTAALISGDPRVDARMKKASRAAERNGWWICGSTWKARPPDIGFQYGYLLSAEIEDAINAISAELKYDDKVLDWDFYRKTVRAKFLGCTSNSSVAKS